MRSKASRVIRVQIERFVEEFDRAVQILDLVAVDLRLREDVTRLDLALLFVLGDRLQRVDHLLPVSRRLVELQELVQEHVVLRLQIASFLQGVDGLLRVFLAFAPNVADIVQDLEALFTVVHAIQDLALVGRDLLPIIALGIGVDQGLERGAVLAVQPERPSRSC